MSKHVFPPRQILVPTDFGPASNVAMGFARMLHEKFGVPVEVLHSCHLEVPAYFSSGQLQAIKREIGKAKQSAEELIRKDSSARLGFEAGRVILDQSPVEAILQQASRLEGGLVLMGTHGRQGARRLMLGSVAERVLRQSRIPVLAVRESAKPGLFRNIFCPFNHGAAGRAALEYAADMAAATDAQLTVLHAKESGVRSVCESLEEPLRRKCTVEEIAAGGDAARGILEAAQRARPDVIVMGAEQKSTVIGELFSSTTERVMQLAEAPLLVVPRQ